MDPHSLVSLNDHLEALSQHGEPLAAIALYLFGMGLVNPLGTVIALDPFHDQAGLASALLGFSQMACAALGSALASVLPASPFVALALVLSGSSALALLAFTPVVLRKSQTVVGMAKGIER